MKLNIPKKHKVTRQNAAAILKDLRHSLKLPLWLETYHKPVLVWAMVRTLPIGMYLKD